MSTAPKHPAAGLPEDQRIEYFRAVATVAFVDGSSARAEVAKLRRLGEVLDLSPAFIETQVEALAMREAQDVNAAVTWVADDDTLRQSLMTDVIVLAFADGKLAVSESRQLLVLARQLGFTNAEVVKMAEFVEKVLFKHRAADQQTLAREFGDVLASGGKVGWFGWIRNVFGD